MFSRELILKCFPHKESILFNLDVAISLLSQRESLTDMDRIEDLCRCHQCLEHNNIQEAASFAKNADYLLMGDAILFHFGS